MASLIATAARQASSAFRIMYSNSSAQSFNLIQRSGLASAADHHGPPKVNCWQDPMNPSNWKEEHFGIVTLTGWGLLVARVASFSPEEKTKRKRI